MYSKCLKMFFFIIDFAVNLFGFCCKAIEFEEKLLKLHFFSLKSQGPYKHGPAIAEQFSTERDHQPAAEHVQAKITKPFFHRHEQYHIYTTSLPTSSTTQ